MKCVRKIRMLVNKPTRERTRPMLTKEKEIVAALTESVYEQSPISTRHRSLELDTLRTREF